MSNKVCSINRFSILKDNNVASTAVIVDDSTSSVPDSIPVFVRDSASVRDTVLDSTNSSVYDCSPVVVRDFSSSVCDSVDDYVPASVYDSVSCTALLPFSNPSSAPIVTDYSALSSDIVSVPSSLPNSDLVLSSVESQQHIIIPVCLVIDNNRIQAQAMLDSGASSCFID